MATMRMTEVMTEEEEERKEKLHQMYDAGATISGCEDKWHGDKSAASPSLHRGQEIEAIEDAAAPTVELHATEANGFVGGRVRRLLTLSGEESEWMECVNDCVDGEEEAPPPYYCNLATGETTWLVPYGVLLASNTSADYGTAAPGDDEHAAAAHGGGEDGDTVTIQEEEVAALVAARPELQLVKRVLNGTEHRLDPHTQLQLEEARRRHRELEELRDHEVRLGGEHWVEMYDPTHDSFYFYGIHSGEIRWTRPDSYVLSPESDDILRMVVQMQCAMRMKLARRRVLQRRLQLSTRQLPSTDDGDGGGGGGDGGDVENKEEEQDADGLTDLLHPWVEVYDPLQKVLYYYCSATQETRWEPPAQYISATEDEAMAAAIVIQSMTRSRRARLDVKRRRTTLVLRQQEMDRAASRQQREARQRAFLAQPEHEREQICQRELLEEELAQRAQGDSFWGLERRDHEVLRQRAEEKMLVEAERFWRRVNASLKLRGRHETSFSHADREAKREHQRMAEAKALDEMRAAEREQCQDGDGFWGIQAQERREARAREEMEAEADGSQLMGALVRREERHRAWGEEAARLTEELETHKVVQEKRNQRAYFTWFYGECETAEEVLAYAWPVVPDRSAAMVLAVKEEEQEEGEDEQVEGGARARPRQSQTDNQGKKLLQSKTNTKEEKRKQTERTLRHKLKLSIDTGGATSRGGPSTTKTPKSTKEATTRAPSSSPSPQPSMYRLDDRVIHARHTQQMRYGDTSIYTIHDPSESRRQGRRGRFTFHYVDTERAVRDALEASARESLVPSPARPMPDECRAWPRELEDARTNGDRLRYGVFPWQRFQRSSQPDPNVPARYNGVPYQASELSPMRELLLHPPVRHSQLPSLAPPSVIIPSPSKKTSKRVKPSPINPTNLRRTHSSASSGGGHTNANNTNHANANNHGHGGDSQEEKKPVAVSAFRRALDACEEVAPSISTFLASTFPMESRTTVAKQSLRARHPETEHERAARVAETRGQRVRRKWVARFRRRELPRVTQLFALMDVDGSRSVSQTEIVWALHRDGDVQALARGSPLLQLLVKQPAHLVSLFAQLRAVGNEERDDVGSGDDEISWDVFRIFCEEMYVQLMEQGLLTNAVAVDGGLDGSGGQQRRQLRKRRAKDKTQATDRTVGYHHPPAETTTDATHDTPGERTGGGRRRNRNQPGAVFSEHREEALVRRVFQLCDQDGNGFLEMEELRRALSSSVDAELQASVASSHALQPLLREDTFVKAFRAFQPVDARGISEEEFVVFCLESAEMARVNGLL